MRPLRAVWLPANPHEDVERTVWVLEFVPTPGLVVAVCSTREGTLRSIPLGALQLATLPDGTPLEEVLVTEEADR